MKNDYSNSLSTNQSGINQLTDQLKSNISKFIKVASIGKVIAVDIGNDITDVELVPLTSSEDCKITRCHSSMVFNGFSAIRLSKLLKKGCFVIVIFMDRDSSSTISQIMNNNPITKISDNKINHQSSQGIIISLFNL